MLQGDLATMSLADVLQWADAISTAGVLTLERGSVHFWCRIESRYVVRVELAGAQVALPSVQASAIEGLGLEPRVLARERLYDQFLDSGERFRFEPDAENPDVGLELRLSLQQLVMEGLRILDEWPRLRAAYPADQARLEATGAVLVIEDPSVIHRAVLTCAERGLTLSQARIALGLSRPALLRAVDELRAAGSLVVESAPSGIDLMTQLTDQASALIRARQFDEAQLVLRALLTTDPSSTRVKELLREADLLHVQALYTELTRDAVVHEGNALDAGATLSATERAVLDTVNGRWDVTTLVLASQRRELETLKALRRLWRQGLVQLHRP